MIGDGIRESAEQIAEYLKQFVGIRFTFALAELAIFEMPASVGGGIIVEPRVLVRTVEIERAVVRVVSPGVTVDPLPVTDGRGGPMTRKEFYDQLSAIDADLPRKVQAFFKRYTALDEEACKDELARASCILRWYRKSGGKVNFGALFPDGTLNTNYIVWNAEEIGNPQIGIDYSEAVAGLIPGAAVRKKGNYWTWNVRVNNKLPEISEVLAKSDAWLRAIEKAILDSGSLRSLDSTRLRSGAGPSGTHDLLPRHHCAKQTPCGSG